MATESNSPPKALAYQGVYRSTPIPSCLLSRDDLVTLYEDLERKTQEGIEHSLARAQRPADTSEAEFEELKKRGRESGHLSAFIYGADGERMVVSSAPDFRSQRLPDTVTSILYDSAASIRTLHKFEPENRFRLNLDFTEPPGFDKYDPASNPTPNNSSFEIIGPDSTWVAGVHETVMGFLERRGRRRGWLHKHSWYNAYQWFVAIPGSLWIVFRISQGIQGVLERWHPALEGALYILPVPRCLLVLPRRRTRLSMGLSIGRVEGFTKRWRSFGCYGRPLNATSCIGLRHTEVAANLNRDATSSFR